MTKSIHYYLMKQHTVQKINTQRNSVQTVIAKTNKRLLLEIKRESSPKRFRNIFCRMKIIITSGQTNFQVVELKRKVVGDDTEAPCITRGGVHNRSGGNRPRNKTWQLLKVLLRLTGDLFALFVPQ